MENNTEEKHQTTHLLWHEIRARYIVLAVLTTFLILAMTDGLFLRERGKTIIFSENTVLTFVATFDALLLLSIGFFWGCLGGITRTLMSGLSLKKTSRIIFSSGLMAAFAWMGIESQIFLKILIPTLNQTGEGGFKLEKFTISKSYFEFAFLAVIVGMFSSNIYIFIEQRVRQLTAPSEDSKNITHTNEPDTLEIKKQ